MKAIALFAGIALAAVSTPALAASPVDGKWTVEAKTDFGTFKSHWTVAESGGATTVEMADEPMAGAPTGAAPPASTISDIKVDGNVLSFKRQLDMGQGPMTLNYTATVDGDMLTGTANSDFGPVPITGTRE